MARTAGSGEPKVNRVKKEKVVKPKYVKPPKPPVVLNKKEKFTCTWCGRIFSAQKTQLIHLCEQRRRYQQKDTLYCRYGLQAYLSIQDTLRGNKKTEEDFRKSDFYLACVRWGRFVLDVNCPNPSEYLKWLQKNTLPIDTWNTDSVYSIWLQEIAFTENPWDAIDRSIQTMIDWAESKNVEFNLYFKDAPGSTILFDVQRGRISGWVVYNSTLGQEWLTNLASSDLELVWPMLDSARWSLKFKKMSDIHDQIKEVCQEAGL